MSDRRRGNEDSRTRVTLIDAATRLLVDEGVGAVTARRVAQAVGLSHQIVHYYFKPMDALVAAVIEHGTAGAVEDLRRAVSTDDPLEAVVRQNSALMAVAAGTEFTLYANRRPAVREAVKNAVESYRAVQVEALAKHLERSGRGEALAPAVATIVLTSVLRTFVLERAVGVSEGHDETMAWLGALLSAPALARPV
jgi:TetR/AcrR family transcriptional regulator